MTSAGILFLNQKYKRTIVVGDIHACYDEFCELLQQMQFAADDLLISLGDIINRGPKPLQCLRFFRDTPNAYLIRGNHEWRLIDLFQEKAQAKWAESLTLEAIPKNEWPAWCTYLQTCPSLIHTPELIATHACLNPRYPIDEQTGAYTSGYNAPWGTLAKDAETIPLWYYEWAKNWPNDTRSICVGHDQYQKIELVHNRLFALDTKVARGRQLSALEFPTKKTYQVNAKRNYYLSAKYAYYRALSATNPELVPDNILAFFKKNE